MAIRADACMQGAIAVAVVVGRLLDNEVLATRGADDFATLAV